MKLKITHVEGSKKGTVENIDAPVVTVGRDPSNTIVFDPVKDDRVSTKHATLSEQGGQVIVTDLGSRNGTLVGGQKITGPTPVPPGGLVQFGEHGPLVMVSYEAAGAPAAAAPAKKKGGGGACVIVAILLLLVLGGGAVAAIFLLKGGKTGSAWARVGIGSEYDVATDTHIEKPTAMDSKMEMHYTLVSRTDDVAKVKMETKVGDATTMTTMEQEIPLHPKGDEKPAEKPLEEKSESVTVPAGTFSCTYTKMKSGDATIETWISNDVPVPVKTVSSTDTMKTTSTLVKIDKK